MNLFVILQTISPSFFLEDALVKIKMEIFRSFYMQASSGEQSLGLSNAFVG